MVKRIIKTTIVGIVVSVAAIKIAAIFLGGVVLDTILRWLSPLGVTLSIKEFAQIIFTGLITAFMAHLIYTGKLDKYLPKQFKKLIG